MHHYKIYQIILLLTPFVFSFALGLDIYIPIVPQMTKIFETTPALIHLTLSLFLFTTGLGQLFVGPFADRYGRKVILYLGALSFFAGSLLCAFAPDIIWLIMGRFIAAIGACGLIVTSFALVRDLYSADESARMYSFLNGAVGISPTFAPMIGGYLALYLGWQSIFIFLAAIGILNLCTTRYFIQETLLVENRIPIDRKILSRYFEIFTTRQFVIFSAISGLAEGIFFCFFSISPFIIIDLLGVPLENFGYYFATFGLVIALGGFASGKLIEKTSVNAAISTGIFLMLIGGCTMLAWFSVSGLSLTGFLFPMILACTGSIFVVGACASAALEPFAAIAGTASAAFGAFQFSLSALIGAGLMLFPIESTVPYGIVIVVTGILSFFLYRQRPAKMPEFNVA